MADPKEVADWNYWAAEKDKFEAMATPAGQLAVKHARAGKKLTELEQRLADEEKMRRDNRPENVAMKEVQGYAGQLAAAVERVLASPSPATAMLPSPSPGYDSSLSPVPGNFSPAPAVSPQANALMPSPAGAMSPAAGVDSTPRTQKRQQRQL